MLLGNHVQGVGKEERSQLVLRGLGIQAGSSEGVPRGRRGTLFCLIVAAMFTLLPSAAETTDSTLAEELFAEANWQACRTECLRLIHLDGDSVRVAEMAATAEAHTWNPPDRTFRHSLLTLPARWLIAFYQQQIAPAIGRRCSLQPSCSAYAGKALRKHGLLGLAIYADRCIREPHVVSERRAPVMIDGTLKYEDPLEDHDYWLE